jgi:4-hydroxy-tetrahydrodipicolinate reductase
MKVVVMAPKGKMGRLIVKLADGMEGLELVGAVGPAGRDYIGSDAGIAAGTGKETGALVYGSLEEVIVMADVVVDYTNPELSMEVLETARSHNKAVVCGTTGFSAADMEKIRSISRSIPLVFAANTSMVVNLMYSLLKTAAETIGSMSDIEIIEMHDRYKKDAPSGTSKEMGEVIAEAMGNTLSDVAVFGREGHGERVPGSIGYHSVRAGDISSSHTVMFGLLGERLEITHHAHNWECFANGACIAAKFLSGKPSGFYTVKDVLEVEENG